VSQKIRKPSRNMPHSSGVLPKLVAGNATPSGALVLLYS
jgi:hypothetical protein